MKDKKIYSINIEDIQNVANEEFGRDLTQKEIEQIEDTIGERINWYETIMFSILDKLNLEFKTSKD